MSINGQQRYCIEDNLSRCSESYMRQQASSLVLLSNDDLFLIRNMTENVVKFDKIWIFYVKKFPLQI